MPYLVIHPRQADRIWAAAGLPRGATLTLDVLASAFTEPGQHRHRSYVEGCLRCELSADEVETIAGR